VTRNTLILLATLGSAAALGGAFFSQYAWGMLPCQLCLWQRWPHGLAILAGVLGLALPGRIWTALGALGAAASGAVAVFHTGVERAWWEGLDNCSGGSAITGISAADLLNPAINVAPIVRCDVPTEFFLHLSMANWNAILCAGLVLLWLLALRKPA
jgi:disulfide bond formation protein DsbB